MATFEWGWMDWDRTEDRVLDESEWNGQTGGYDPDFIIPEDRPDADNFLCEICLDLVRDPMIHAVGRCRGLFCQPCIVAFIRFEQRTNGIARCPRRCGSESPLALTGYHTTVTRLPERMKENLNNLRMKCQHPGCQEVVKYSDFEEHTENCTFGSRFCQYCKVLNEDHDCASLIDSLRQKINELEAKVAQLENNQSREASPAPSSSAETVSQQRPLTGARGISNHLRSRDPYRGGRPDFHCRFRGREVTISGIFVDQPASYLRARLKREFGQRLGPILMMSHQTMDDSKLIRQHGIGSKPVNLIALEPGREIPDGQSLNVLIGPNGPIH